MKKQIVCQNCAYYDNGTCRHNNSETPKLEYSTCPCATARPVAYKVFDNAVPEYSIVVFATSAGKAKWLALHDEFAGYEFLELRAIRIKSLDSCYQPNKITMDWYNTKDRESMYYLGGYRCEEIGYGLCDDCTLKEKCEIYLDYQEYLKELEEEENELETVR